MNRLIDIVSLFASVEKSRFESVLQPMTGEDEGQYIGSGELEEVGAALQRKTECEKDGDGKSVNRHVYRQGAGGTLLAIGDPIGLESKVTDIVTDQKKE